MTIDLRNLVERQAARIAELEAVLAAALPYLESQYERLPDDGTAQDFMMTEVIEPARTALKGKS